METRRGGTFGAAMVAAYRSLATDGGGAGAKLVFSRNSADMAMRRRVGIRGRCCTVAGWQEK